MIQGVDLRSTTTQTSLLMKPNVDAVLEQKSTRSDGSPVDTDELLVAQDTLQSTQSKLALASEIASASELAGSIVHEISQPLSRMVTNGQACLHWLENDPPNLMEAISAARRLILDGSTAAAIVTGLRSLFSKTTQEKTALAIEQVVVDTLHLLRGKIQRARVNARVEISRDLPLVLGGTIALQQVLMNLLMNAVESIPAEAAIREVVIRSSHTTRVVTISVEDSGTRPTNYIEIFAPFFSSKVNGMGLGLPIARSIIESHGGQLRANPSPLGTGSTFQFTLPTAAEGQHRE